MASVKTKKIKKTKSVSPAKKTLKVVAKKATVKNPVAKKRPVVKKAPVNKAKRFKPLGIFIALGGSLSLFAILFSASAIINPASADQPVLGWLSNASRIATPTSPTLKTSNAYINLSWKSVSGAVLYKVYRSTSFFGGMTLLTKTTATSYSDATALPGKTYYYQISAANARGEGSKSVKSSIVNSQVSKPQSVSFNALRSTAVGITRRYDTSVNGAYVYCSGCSKKKYSLSSAESKEVQFGGVTDETSAAPALITMSLSGLSANTTYKMSLTNYRVINGKRYESPRTTAQSVATLPFDNNNTPTGLAIGELSSSSGEVWFTWDNPTSAVDGYSITLWNEANQDVVTRDISFSSTWLNAYGQRMYDMGDGLRSTAGTTYHLSLQSYIIANGVKILSQAVSASFN